MKCFNNPTIEATLNMTWPTSMGVMSVNVCDKCAASWWAKYKNTPAGQGMTLGAVKSEEELRELCAAYDKDTVTTDNKDKQ